MAITPETRLHVDVEVLIDDTWRPGTLEHRRPAGDGREGFVRWSTGPGENRMGCYPYERLRAPNAAA
jgi:hypothetical protein